MNNLIYQRSVFSMESKLNKEKIINNYFQLENIKNLRLIDNQGIILNLRKKLGLKQKDIAKLLNTSERNSGRWEWGKRAIPYNKFLILMNKFKIKDKSKIKYCLFSLGNHRGGSKIRLPLKVNGFLLAKYLIPYGKYKVYVVKNTPKNIKYYIINNFKIDKINYKKWDLLTIYSELLNKFLRTFYIYEKKNKLNFPLSLEVPKWKDIDLSKAVVIPYLLSDGGEKPNKRLCFFGASKNLHKIWSDSMFYLYNIYPSSYILPHKSIYSTTHFVSENILENLKKLCPNFKTSPYIEEIKDYLKKPQPSIKYLYKAKKLEQQIAIRIWSSTEGSVSITLDKRTGLINPLLKIACAHPKLIQELKFLCKKHNINLFIKREPKNWSGVGGLESRSINSVINFLKINGFIDNVQIAKSRSKYFGGLNKRDVLLGIFEFILRQRENKFKIKNKIQAYKNIRKIILNKEFKDREYYINIFGKDFDNWSFRRKKCL